MTHDKTDNLITKIIEKPEQLTDAEIAEIISDDYMRSLYDTASLLKTATEQSRSYDLDREWLAMRARLNGNALKSNASHEHRWLRVAVIFICILICGAVGILFFRVSDEQNAKDMTAETSNGSINIEKLAENIAHNVGSALPADTIKDIECDRKKAPRTIPKTKDPEKLAQGGSSVIANDAQTCTLPSISQALFLTDEDMMIAQTFLASSYDLSAYDNQNFVTTVNFGDNRPEVISQPTWLSEVMKYATGLTVDNLMIQRGSANMLFRLTDACAEVSPSDRKAALSIISSLVSDGICDNDPLTMALVLGSQENLR